METREHAPHNAWLPPKYLSLYAAWNAARGALFLLTWHAAQLLSLLPSAIYLLCPLMMLFMRKGMGGGQGDHDGHEGSDQQGWEKKS